MTGDGGVLKRRLRAGVGEFPVDCPLTDTTVRLHYRARPAGAADADGWAYDSRARSGAAESNGSAAGAHANGGSSNGNHAAHSNGGGGSSGGGAPLEFDTGCGEQPEAVELCARLMVPGELARAVAQPRYAYQVGRWGARGADASWAGWFACVAVGGSGGKAYEPVVLCSRWRPHRWATSQA
jgi:hypothetical protein